VESSYCFPAEIAHGAVQDIFDRKIDYIFLPHFKDLEGYEKNTPASFCPITQSLPYYIKKAFPEIPEGKYLAPVVSFMYGLDKAAGPFIAMAAKLGFGEAEARRAFTVAYEKQKECFARFRELGQEALAKPPDTAAHDRHTGRPTTPSPRTPTWGFPGNTPHGDSVPL
jgi:predicted nucleotide-binding protein (sugar kinase/HSP70/actin superfamily)